MKLFLLTQTENRAWSTYDSCVVCAETAEDAKTITPDGRPMKEYSGTWARNIENIQCREIGIAGPNEQRGVIIASFNAG